MESERPTTLHESAPSDQVPPLAVIGAGSVSGVMLVVRVLSFATLFIRMLAR